MKDRRAEDGKQHLPPVVGAVPRQPGDLADPRPAAVATDDEVRAEDRPAGAVGAAERDPDPGALVRHLLRLPTEHRLDRPDAGETPSQHGLGQILRQPRAGLAEIGVERPPRRRDVPMLARQVAIGDEEVARKIGRQELGRAQLAGDAPGMEMLQRALGEVLSLGDGVRLAPPFHQDAGDTPQPEIEGEGEADRAAADNRDPAAPVRRPAAQVQQTKALAVPVPAFDR